MGQAHGSMAWEAKGRSGVATGSCNPQAQGYPEGPNVSVCPPGIWDPVQHGCYGMVPPPCCDTVLVEYECVCFPWLPATKDGTGLQHKQERHAF